MATRSSAGRFHRYAERDVLNIGLRKYLLGQSEPILVG
jgi:hypothetical protein